MSFWLPYLQKRVKTPHSIAISFLQNNPIIFTKIFDFLFLSQIKHSMQSSTGLKTLLAILIYFSLISKILLHLLRTSVIEKYELKVQYHRHHSSKMVKWMHILFTFRWKKKIKDRERNANNFEMGGLFYVSNHNEWVRNKVNMLIGFKVFFPSFFFLL